MTTEAGTQVIRPPQFSKEEVIAYANGLGFLRTPESMAGDVEHVYSWIEQNNPDIIQILSEHLRGKAVADIHCGGPKQFGFMADFVKKCGASGYSGVDDCLLPQAEEGQISYSDDFILFHSDLPLKHLANQPDRCGPICINGISNISIRYPNYPSFLAQEIVRVAGQNIVFGFASEEVSRELRRRGFEDILNPEWAGGGFSFNVLKGEE